MLRGWHANNGVVLNNPRLGFVCTGQTVDGQPGLKDTTRSGITISRPRNGSSSLPEKHVRRSKSIKLRAFRTQLGRRNDCRKCFATTPWSTSHPSCLTRSPFLAPTRVATSPARPRVLPACIRSTTWPPSWEASSRASPGLRPPPRIPQRRRRSSMNPTDDLETHGGAHCPIPGGLRCMEPALDGRCTRP
jgi:hypothetical protein